MTEPLETMYGREMSETKIEAAVARFVAELSHLVRLEAVAAVTAALGGSGAAPRTTASFAAPKKRGRPTKAAAAAKAAAASPKTSPAKKAAAPKKAAKSGKRVRRSAEQIEAAAKRITEYVAKNPGSRAEQIKKGLSIPDNQWGLPIAMALDTKRISSKGQKRATQYFPGK